MRYVGGLLLFHILLLPIALGGNSSKVIHAVRTQRPLAVDGLLHEWWWETAPPVQEFTQYYPDEGAAATESTSVRILYDDKAIYVGVICYDKNPRGIVSQLTRRDRTSEADRFTVQIDSYHDHQTAFVFSVNVAGVQSDGVLSQDGNVYDLSYDAVWNVRTARHREGWSAEFEIPYNALRFSSQPDGNYTWGINFRRYISRKHETDEWVMVPSKERLLISRWGHVEGIKEIKPPLHLSVIPYVSGIATFETASPTRPYRSEKTFKAGLDLKYGLSRNFTLDAAINPDFGQVEVDQAILNLTVFETFYPEKRPFFIEGSQLFSFGNAVDNSPLTLFYSRRIGQRPFGSYSVTAPVGGSVETNPLTTTILGAAKLTGHSESGFSLGLLTSATDEEHATVHDSLGRTSSVQTQPRGTYNAVRIKQELGTSSWVGGMATLAARESTLPAFSGGIDWNVRTDDGTYTLDGYLAGVHSSSVRNNPDGSAGRILFSRIAAEHWYYTASYNFFSANFNSNDMGFFAQPRYHGGYVQLLYRENKAEGLLRRYSFSLVPEVRWNWDDRRTLAQFDLSFASDWLNFWRSTLRYVLNDHAYDDAERGIAGLYLRPISHLFTAQVQTDERKQISVSFTASYKSNQKEMSSVSALLGVTIRPATNIEITPLLYIERTRQEETAVLPFGSGRVVTDSLGHSLFADRDVDDIEFALRGIITFSRTLSFQFYTQVLLPRGRYQRYRSLVGSDQFTPYAGQQFDFNYATFQSNMLLRWEFLPGSAMYLVWTQSRDDLSGDYNTDFGSRFRETFKLPHDDAILLKISYWWGL